MRITPFSLVNHQTVQQLKLELIDLPFPARSYRLRVKWAMGEKASCGQQDSRNAATQTMVGGALSAKQHEWEPPIILKMHVHLHIHSSTSR
jgi:hypothetical protein